MALKINCGSIIAYAKELYVEWKIESYFLRSPENGEMWHSPLFYWSKATWHLELYPNGENKHETAEYLCLFLIKDKPQTALHWAHFTLGIKSSNGSVYKSKEFKIFSFQGNSDYGARKLVKTTEFMQDRSVIAADDVVTFFCAIRSPENCKINSTSGAFLSYNFDALNRDYKNLFLNEKDGDVTFKVKDQEFCAHSLILAARSSYFAKMFTHDMKEKTSRVVEVKDREPEAFREFLAFLYCGETEKISSDNVIDLYCAADKYIVKELKARCSDFMKDEMSKDSFCDVISLALKYEDTELIDYSTQYFIENVKKIYETEKWILFVNNHPVKSNELYVKCVNHLSTDSKSNGNNIQFIS